MYLKAGHINVASNSNTSFGRVLNNIYRSSGHDLVHDWPSRSSPMLRSSPFQQHNCRP